MSCCAKTVSNTTDDIFTARKRSLGQGNIFSSVCQEFCSQEVEWGSASVHAGIPPPSGKADPPRAGGMHHTGMQSCTHIS